MSISVSFPALCVPRDFGVYLVRDRRELRRCRAQLFWRFRHFDGLRLYDSDGAAFRVTTAEVSWPVSRPGRFLARALDLAITVDVEVAPVGPASLPEIVIAVQRSMETDPESLEELSGRSIGWWRVTLARSSSIAELIRAFDH